MYEKVLQKPIIEVIIRRVGGTEKSAGRSERPGAFSISAAAHRLQWPYRTLTRRISGPAAGDAKSHGHRAGRDAQRPLHALQLTAELRYVGPRGQVAVLALGAADALLYARHSCTPISSVKAARSARFATRHTTPSTLQASSAEARRLPEGGGAQTRLIAQSGLVRLSIFPEFLYQNVQLIRKLINFRFAQS